MDNWIGTLFILLFGFSQLAIADGFYSEHASGWHWYDDPEKETQVERKKEPPLRKIETPIPNPDEIVAIARKKVKSATNALIANPTKENAKILITLLNQLGDRGEEVVSAWEKAILENPELNYSLKYPTNNVALRVFQEEESKQKDKSIKLFSEKMGLFFFYRSNCPYCHRFAPILKDFAERYGLTVIPITVDGGVLPEFPNSKMDSGQAKQFNITKFPSVFAVNPYTNKAFPIVYGLTSQDDLRNNIYKIMKQYDGER